MLCLAHEIPDTLSEHRHSCIRYVTPDQRHPGEDQTILAASHQLYQQARVANPTRWSWHTKNWTHVDVVTLNPERDDVIRHDVPTNSQLIA